MLFTCQSFWNVVSTIVGLLDKYMFEYRNVLSSSWQNISGQNLRKHKIGKISIKNMEYNQSYHKQFGTFSIYSDKKFPKYIFLNKLFTYIEIDY